MNIGTKLSRTIRQERVKRAQMERTKEQEAETKALARFEPEGSGQKYTATDLGNQRQVLFSSAAPS